MEKYVHGKELEVTRLKGWVGLTGATRGNWTPLCVMEYVTGLRQGSHTYMNKQHLPLSLGSMEEKMEACCQQSIRQGLEETRWPNVGQ